MCYIRGLEWSSNSQPVAEIVSTFFILYHKTRAGWSFTLLGYGENEIQQGHVCDNAWRQNIPWNYLLSLYQGLYYLLYDQRFCIESVQFSSVQLLSHVQLFATPWTAAHQASLSITNSRSLLKLTCMESGMPMYWIAISFLFHFPLFSSSVFSPR